MYGKDGNDICRGQDGRDLMKCGRGNEHHDVLYGGDTMYGGRGGATFVYDPIGNGE